MVLFRTVSFVMLPILAYTSSEDKTVIFPTQGMDKDEGDWLLQTRQISTSDNVLDGGGNFEIVSNASKATGSGISVRGPCTVEDNCVMSGNYPNHYAKNEYCNIQLPPSSPLRIESFETEGGYDILTLNGRRFSGTRRPQENTVVDSGTIVWTSDYSEQSSGWKICVTTNTCTCPEGTPATGTACTTDKAEICVGCGTGYTLIGDTCNANTGSEGTTTKTTPCVGLNTVDLCEPCLNHIQCQSGKCCPNTLRCIDDTTRQCPGVHGSQLSKPTCGVSDCENWAQCCDMKEVDPDFCDVGIVIGGQQIIDPQTKCCDTCSLTHPAGKKCIAANPW